MTNQVQWGAGGVEDIPAGWHPAIIRGYEDFDSKFGPAWKFAFGILLADGEVELTRLVSKPKNSGRVSKKTTLFKIHTALGGTAGTGKLDLDSWIGQRLRVFVETDESDPDAWPNITKFAPPKQTSDGSERETAVDGAEDQEDY